jgi:type II secretory pathway predicted ATPase ExeA
MFLEYFNLRQQPFGATPDPRFLYMSRAHSEALASLWYGIQQDRGFMVLAAPPGMGKTTLLFQLLGHLRESARTVFLFQTQCDSRELFRYLLRDLGITPGPDMASMHEQLNQVIVEEARAGRRVVFVIDEAQNLKGSVLETIRLLSDFETSQRKLLQIVLAGHSEFIATLLRPDLEQLKQRIAMLSYLRPLNRQELGEYIALRLEKAGYQGPALFTSDALEIIAQGSGGIPRNINHLCFNALSIACALRKKRVDRAVAEEALEDRKFESLLRPAAPAQRPAIAAPVVTAVAPRRRKGMRQAFTLAAAVIVAALLGASTGLYAQRARWTPHLPSAIKSAVARFDTPAAPEVAPPPAPAAQPAPRSDPPKPALPRRDLVVVEPHQTLTDISNLYLGEYNAAVLARLRELNPGLGDPDHLEVGQKIRLPLAGESDDGEEVTMRQAAPSRNGQ